MVDDQATNGTSTNSNAVINSNTYTSYRQGEHAHPKQIDSGVVWNDAVSAYEVPSGNHAVVVHTIPRIEDGDFTMYASSPGVQNGASSLKLSGIFYTDGALDMSNTFYIPDEFAAALESAAGEQASDGGLGMYKWEKNVMKGYYQASSGYNQPDPGAFISTLSPTQIFISASDDADVLESEALLPKGGGEIASVSTKAGSARTMGISKRSYNALLTPAEFEPYGVAAAYIRVPGYNDSPYGEYIKVPDNFWGIRYGSSGYNPPDPLKLPCTYYDKWYTTKQLVVTVTGTGGLMNAGNMREVSI